MIQLYPDQQQSIDIVRQKMGQGIKSILLQGATGTGKSYMAAAILKGADAKGTRTWFTVPRRQLIHQMDETYDRFDLNHSFIASTYGYNKYEQHNICSLQTLDRRLDKVQPPQLAIIDECHYGGADLDRLIQWLKDSGSYIIGLSATPLKTNGKPMGDHYDDMVTGPSVRWMIDNGRLCDYRLLAPDVPTFTGVRVSNGDYVQKQLEQALFEDGARLGNAVKHYRNHCLGKRTVVFGHSVADCQRIAAEFNNSGIPAAVISAKTPDVERKQMINALADGKLVLINCNLLIFGFDLASQVGRDVTVEALIDMSPTKSLSNQMQKWGRVLRRKDDKAIILDLAGNVAEHDKPCAEREWTLEGRDKRKRGDGEEKTINVRQCTYCGYCFIPAPVCPKCSTPVPVKARDIDEVDGELIEVNVKQFKKEKRMEVGRARTIADLKEIARIRGYKPGWVYQQAKVKGIKY